MSSLVSQAIKHSAFPEMELWNAPPFPWQDCSTHHASLITATPLEILQAIRYVCSHDLRSPLAAIDLAAQLLNSSDVDTSQEQAARIRRQTAKALQLTDTLLHCCLVAQQRLIPCWSFFEPTECLEKSLANNARPPIPIQLPQKLSCWGDPQLTILAISQLISGLLKIDAKILKVSITTFPKAGISWNIHTNCSYLPQKSTFKSSAALQFALAEHALQKQHGTLHTLTKSYKNTLFQCWLPFATAHAQLQKILKLLHPWKDLPFAVFSSNPQREQTAAYCLIAAGFKQINTQRNQPSPSSLFLDPLHPLSQNPAWLAQPSKKHGPWLTTLPSQQLTPFSFLAHLADTIAS